MENNIEYSGTIMIDKDHELCIADDITPAEAVYLAILFVAVSVGQIKDIFIFIEKHKLERHFKRVTQEDPPMTCPKCKGAGHYMKSPTHAILCECVTGIKTPPYIKAMMWVWAACTVLLLTAIVVSL